MVATAWLVLGAGGAAPPKPQGPPIGVLRDWMYYNNTGWRALQLGRLERAEQAFRMAIERMTPYAATEAVILAQEKERTEIGKELHDNVNQILGATNLYINTAMTEEDIRQELLERSTLYISNAINEIRKISKSLITPGLHEIGLIESIEDIIEDAKMARDMSFKLEIELR